MLDGDAEPPPVLNGPPAGREQTVVRGDGRGRDLGFSGNIAITYRPTLHFIKVPCRGPSHGVAPPGQRGSHSLKTEKGWSSRAEPPDQDGDLYDKQYTGNWNGAT